MRRRPASRWTATGGRRSGGYVLLETVVATGLLIVGLAVLGAMVQDSQLAMHRMELRLAARWKAEHFLALLDTGLIEFDSADNEIEETFGPRYPQWAWRVIIEETGVDELLLLTVEILHDPLRDDDHTLFDFDDTPVVITLHALRAAPQPVDLGVAFGLREEELAEISEKLMGLGIDGLDPEAFDPSILGKLEFDELIEVLPTLMDAFGLDYSALLSQLPSDLRQQLEESGVLEGLGVGGDESDDGGGSESDAMGGQGP